MNIRTLSLVWAFAGLAACGGGGSAGADAPAATSGATFTIGGTTQSFDAAQCSLVSAGTVYQLMCALPGGTPAINMVLQAPPAVGSYDQTTADTLVSVVDPTVGVQIYSSGAGGTCTVVITETAAPGQGTWRGHFDAAEGGASATGTFDMQVAGL